MPQDAFSLRIASVDYDGKEALIAYSRNRKLSVDEAMPNLSLGCSQLRAFIKNL